MYNNSNSSRIDSIYFSFKKLDTRCSHFFAGIVNYSIKLKIDFNNALNQKSNVDELGYPIPPPLDSD